MSSGGDPNGGLINNNDQLRLVNQLLDRKIRNLQAENQGLRERVRSLTTAEDKDRLQLLLADSERRRLKKLRAIVKHHVSILTSSVREFNAYIEDIDQGIDELKKEGALDPDIIGGLIIGRPSRVTAQLESALTRMREPLRASLTSVDSTLNLNYDLVAESPLIHRAEPAPGSSDNAVAALAVKGEPGKNSIATVIDTVGVEKRKGDRSDKPLLAAITPPQQSAVKPQQQPVSIVRQLPPTQMRACKKTIVKSVNVPAPIEALPPTLPTSVVQSEEPADENCYPKSPVGTGANSSTLCFEDVLSYTIVGPRSFGVSVGGSADSMFPPIYTSTPKAPLPTSMVVRDREGFVPPTAVEASAKPAASKQQLKPKKMFNKPTAKNIKTRSTPLKRTDYAAPAIPPTATTTNRSEGDSGFILDPSATVNVTARRRTSCSYAEPVDEDNETANQTTTMTGDVIVANTAPREKPERDATIVVGNAATSRLTSAADGGPNRKRQKYASDSDNLDYSTFVVDVSSKRQRGAAVAIRPRARQATPMLSAIGKSTPPADPPHQQPADSSVASVSMLADMTSESGRQKRAAVLKVRTYQLPSRLAKLRRE